MLFVAPQHLPIHTDGGHNRTATPRRPFRPRVCYRTQVLYRVAIQAVVPPGSNSERKDDNSRKPEENKNSTFPNQTSDQSQQPMSEIDMFAEQWIGSNISRWEWYERYKSRQQKIDQVNLDNKRRLDEEMRLLKNTLMELEDAFCVGLLDEKSNVSPLGWGLIACIMSSYIACSYLVIHALVSGMLQLSSSYNFP